MFVPRHPAWLLIQFSDIDKSYQTEWESYGKHGIVPAEAWNKVISTVNGILDNDFGKTESDKYIIQVVLVRRATTYNIVFYTPLLSKLLLDKKLFLFRTRNEMYLGT